MYPFLHKLEDFRAHWCAWPQKHRSSNLCLVNQIHARENLLCNLNKAGFKAWPHQRDQNTRYRSWVENQARLPQLVLNNAGLKTLVSSTWAKYTRAKLGRGRNRVDFKTLVSNNGSQMHTTEAGSKSNVASPRLVRNEVGFIILVSSM